MGLDPVAVLCARAGLQRRGCFAHWRAEHTVFAVIAFIAVIMMFMIYWHRAGDVSQAKIEADCQKAGGVWDSKMNMCMEK
jgi:hypothetical protein